MSPGIRALRDYAPIALSALLATGCGQDPGRTEATQPAPRVLETGDCRAERVGIWGRSSGPNASIALAFDEAGGGLALAEASRPVRFIPLSREATPGRERPLRMRAANGLRALLPLSSTDSVLVGVGSCGSHPHCLKVERTSGDAPPCRVPVPALRTLKRRVVGAYLYLAWSATTGERGLERFALEGVTIEHQHFALGTAPADVEVPTEILAVAAAQDGRWAVVWRRGATEDRESTVWLSTREGDRQLPALREALVITFARFVSEELWLVSGFEFSRPALFRSIDENQRIEFMAPDRDLPTALRAEVRGQLLVDDQRVVLERQNALGDPLAPAVQVAAGERVTRAALARVGLTFWAALLRDGEIEGYRVHCDAESGLGQTRD